MPSISPAAQRLIRAACAELYLCQPSLLPGNVVVGSAAIGPKLKALTARDVTKISPPNWAAEMSKPIKDRTEQLLSLTGLSKTMQENAATPAPGKKRLIQGVISVDGGRTLDTIHKSAPAGAKWKLPAEAEMNLKDEVRLQEGLGAKLSRSFKRSETQEAELVLFSIQTAVRQRRCGRWVVDAHGHVFFLVPADFTESDLKALETYINDKLAAMPLTSARPPKIFFEQNTWIETAEHVENAVAYVHAYPIRGYTTDRRYMPLESVVAKGFTGLNTIIDALHKEAWEGVKASKAARRRLRQLVKGFGALTDRSRGGKAKTAKALAVPSPASVAPAAKPPAPARFQAKEPEAPREFLLKWKLIWCHALMREVLMVVVKNPISTDFKGLLKRYAAHCWHGKNARQALMELAEVEALAMPTAEREAFLSAQRQGLRVKSRLERVEAMVAKAEANRQAA